MPSTLEQIPLVLTQSHLSHGCGCTVMYSLRLTSGDQYPITCMSFHILPCKSHPMGNENWYIFQQGNPECILECFSEGLIKIKPPLPRAASSMVHPYNSFSFPHLTCPVLSRFLQSFPQKTSTQLFTKPRLCF